MTDIRDSRGKAGLRDGEWWDERMSLAQLVKRTEFSRPATALSRLGGPVGPGLTWRV